MGWESFCVDLSPLNYGFEAGTLKIDNLSGEHVFFFEKLDGITAEWRSDMPNINRVLIYRLGSIGDFVIALPCLHLIRRRFPSAEITLLTNERIDARAAPAMSVLEGSGLVDDFLAYPVGMREIGRLAGLRNQIRGLRPDLFIYLASRRSFWQVLRDCLFFRSCGIKHMVGFPFETVYRRAHQPAMEGGYWEREANRLARCLSAMGDAAPYDWESWDLAITAGEREMANCLIEETLPSSAFVRAPLGLSIGTKQSINDWGLEAWQVVLGRIGDAQRLLFLIGSEEERARSEIVAKDWPGPVLNACGRATPRVSAALIARAELFLCLDSGPMHLAASVGTPCIAVFSRNNPAGRWFPFGNDHHIFYPENPGDSIRAIRPDDVADAAFHVLNQSAEARGVLLRTEASV
jgi:ADP-heptose:LPS heptosyltransferase